MNPSLLPCVEVPPQTSEPLGTVIWLHGLGANGHDFEPLVPMLHLPQVRFVFPHAPELAVTINGGMIMPAWYDIRSLDDSPDREPIAHILDAARMIEALIAREQERGVPSGRIVLAGFSQGGAMAMHVGLRYPATLLGIMVLSAYLLLPDRLQEEAHEANHETPMLICHGQQDPMVPCQAGERARDRVQALAPQRPVVWQTFPMGHEVCVPEITLIGQWLQERFLAAA